ncbi:hypothetical protein C8A03DRAFT_39336, partial [Achaetomium macrosporum]
MDPAPIAPPEASEPPGAPGALRPPSPAVPNCPTSAQGTVKARGNGRNGTRRWPCTHEMVEAQERAEALPLPSTAPAALGARASGNGLTSKPAADVSDEAGSTIAPRLYRRWMENTDYEAYEDAPWNDDGHEDGVISHTFEGQLDELIDQEEQGTMEESQALSCIE